MDSFWFQREQRESSSSPLSAIKKKGQREKKEKEMDQMDLSSGSQEGGGGFRDRSAEQVTACKDTNF